jgi:hypothetical protein
MFRESKHHRHAFVENFYLLRQILFQRHFQKPAQRLVHLFKRQFESPVMHRHKKICAQIPERLHRLVRPHVDAPETFRVIRANRQQHDFRREFSADFLEAVEIRAVARVINFPALMLQHKSAVAAMTVAQRPRAPMFARRESHLPVALRKIFPMLQLDDTREAEIVREVTDAARHHTDFRVRQFSQSRLVKMIEVRVRQQNQVNRRQIFYLQAGALDAFQQKKPVRKIRVNQHVQVRELDEKRRVADPGDGNLAVLQFWEDRAARPAVARREPALQDQLLKKSARVEMLRRRQVLERARQFPARRGTAGFFFRHRRFDFNSRRAFDQFEN